MQVSGRRKINSLNAFECLFQRLPKESVKTINCHRFYLSCINRINRSNVPGICVAPGAYERIKLFFLAKRYYLRTQRVLPDYQGNIKSSRGSPLAIIIIKL